MIQDQLSRKRHWITGRFVVGIDPAQAKHPAAISESSGNAVGPSVSFNPKAWGFPEQLWFKLKR